jgi:hypothetical protein
VASNPFKRGMAHLYQNTNLEERKYPFRDRCSRQVELTETITVPPGYTVINQSYSTNSKGDYATFDGSILQTDNIINVKETIILKKRIYDPDDWESYRAAVKNQNAFADRPIILIKDK